jgi:hypothetical protein
MTISNVIPLRPHAPIAIPADKPLHAMFLARRLDRMRMEDAR